MTVTANGIYVGQTATFACKEAGKDHVKIRSWLRNGLSLPVDSRITIASPHDDHLTIKRALTLDSGIYTCVAEDGRNASQNLIVYCTSVAVIQSVFMTDGTVLLYHCRCYRTLQNACH